MQALLLSLSIALFSGLMLSRIAKLLGLPAVTAYLIAGILIGTFTEYYTSDTYKPTQKLASTSETGPATIIIGGLSLILPSSSCAFGLFFRFARNPPKVAPFDAAPGAGSDDAKIIRVSAMLEKIIEYAQKRLADRESNPGHRNDNPT